MLIQVKLAFNVIVSGRWETRRNAGRKDAQAQLWRRIGRSLDWAWMGAHDGTYKEHDSVIRQGVGPHAEQQVLPEVKVIKPPTKS